MSIAEKLIQITENQLKVYEAGKKSVEPSEQPVYETIVFAQDCTNAQQVFDILSATMTPEDKLVIFVNKAWTGVPNTDTVNNKGLWMLCVSKEFNITGLNSSTWARWRNGAYYANAGVNAGYDYAVSAGEEWLKVVLL
jgi:hypothetical protein